MQTLEPILAEHPFLQGLAPEYMQLLVSCASNVRFNSGEYIFQTGQAADKFYIVRQGKVALETPSPTHGELTILTVGPGDVLGWSWLVSPYRWHFDARVLEVTRAIAFDARCLRDKCDANHDLGYEMMKRFAQVFIERLEATRLQLLDVYAVHT